MVLNIQKNQAKDVKKMIIHRQVKMIGLKQVVDECVTIQLIVKHGCTEMVLIVFILLVVRNRSY